MKLVTLQKMQDIYKNMKQDLDKVEERIQKSIQIDEPHLNQSASHLLEAGGKRVRPLLVLLCGKMGQYNLEEVLPIAASLEIIHMATLVHDDVIDDAKTRRGRKTVKEEWDNKVAMYTGDYLTAKSLLEMNCYPDPRVHQILSSAIVEMILGEIDQIRDLYQPNQDLKNYLRRIKRKTALLMAISCQLGAVGGRADELTIRLLYNYGYALGMAFQLTDDVLDLIGDEKTIGKPLGGDLRQGNVTLPVIYALKHLSPVEKEPLLTYLEQKGENRDDLPEILQLVRKAGGVEYTMNLSRRYLEKALRSLQPLPATSERDSLRLIAEFVLYRTH